MHLDFPLFDDVAAAHAAAHQARLTKPAGALGRLERLAVHLAGAQARGMPASRPAACVIFASDHPVVRHGVSAYPAEVTAAMVANFVAGGAAASVICERLGVPLQVVDVGVATPHGPPVVRSPAAALAVGDLRVEDAMPAETFASAWQTGREVVAALDPSTRVLVLGEMGIGNTTPASALAAALLGLSPERAVGAGTGIDAEGRARKVAVVKDALARVEGEQAPLELLRRLGGRELVAIAGAAAEAASRRIMVLVDGFIVSAALLALARHAPAVLPFLVAAHRSREPAHRALLEALFASEGFRGEPLLDLDLALGEGSGALVALPLVDLAVETHTRMATFESASVPNRTSDPAQETEAREA